MLQLHLLATAFATASPPIPLDLSTWANKRVLFITAHPDDVEGFAGGLARSLFLRGDINTTYLIATSGNAGGSCYTTPSNGSAPQYDPTCEKEELALVRRRESIAAAAYNGVPPPYRMGLDDGLSIEYDEARLRRGITGWIRVVRPHIIVTHFPQPNWGAPPTCNGACGVVKGWDDLGYHPDHKHVGKVVFDTVYTAGGAASNSRLFEDIAALKGGAAWKGVEKLFFFALTANQPMTHYLPLSEDLLQAKVAASMLHQSQYLGNETATMATYRWIGRAVGAEAMAHRMGEGGSEGSEAMAEGFQGWY